MKNKLALVAIVLAVAAFFWKSGAHDRPSYIVVESVTAAQLEVDVTAVNRLVFMAEGNRPTFDDLSRFGRVTKMEAGGKTVAVVNQLNGTALDNYLRMDSFTGSPTALLHEIGSMLRLSLVDHPPRAGAVVSSFQRDILSRVTIRDFDGRVRELLATAIPSHYPIIAFGVYLDDNKTPVVSYYGNASRYFNSPSLLLTEEEQEKEGLSVVVRPGNERESYNKAKELVLRQINQLYGGAQRAQHDNEGQRGQGAKIDK